jgi:hypothetical protein
MTTIVIMPGGFHPYHAGHHALYQSAQRTFPDAEVYVAATNDTSSRPFPFAVKEKLAKLAGVDAGHFVQVKSPFRAEEITSKFDPQKDVLIFVRSEKDAKSPPQPGGVKKDGSPSYLQPLLGAKRLEPFSKHAYMAYLPTVEFGPGMTSATQIRAAWPTLNEKRKTALVMSLYPRTQTSPKLAQTVVKLLDTAIGGDSVEEDISRRGFLRGLGAAAVAGAAGGAMAAPFRHNKTVDPMTDKAEGRNSTVASDDGTARLYIQWNDGVWFDSTQGLLGFDSVSGKFPVQSMRIKIGNSPVEKVVGVVNKNFRSMQIGGIFDSNDTKAWAHRILKHSGELRIEVLLASGNKKVFKFTIEPDSTTRDFAAKQKQQDIQQRQQAEKDKVAQEKQKQDDEKRASEREEQRLKDLEIERKRQEEEMRPELERQAKIRKIESELYQYNKQISANILNNFQQMLGNKLKNISHIQRTNTTVQVDKDGNIIKINVEPNPQADELFGPKPIGRSGLSSFDKVALGQDAYNLLKNPKFYNGLFTNIPPDLFQSAMDENGLMTINLNLGNASITLGRAGYNNQNKLGGKIIIPKLRDLGVRSNFDINESNNQGVAEGAPIVVALAPIDVRNPKKAPQPYRNQGDIVPPTTPPSTEKRGVKGRPGQRPMPQHNENNDYLDE